MSATRNWQKLMYASALLGFLLMTIGSGVFWPWFSWGGVLAVALYFAIGQVLFFLGEIGPSAIGEQAVPYLVLLVLTALNGLPEISLTLWRLTPLAFAVFLLEYHFGKRREEKKGQA